jgi:hypothetical protein
MGCSHSLTKLRLQLFDVEVYDPATKDSVSFTDIARGEDEQAQMAADRRNAGPAVHTTAEVLAAEQKSRASTASNSSASQSSNSTLPPSTSSGGDLASQWQQHSQAAAEAPSNRV